MKSPIERMRDSDIKLSTAQKRIAQCFVDEGESISYISLTELSELANVTPVTVINFCKKLGYANYSDLKKEFQAYFKDLRIPQVVKKNTDSYQVESENDLLRRTIIHELQLIERTFDALSEDSIIQAANMLWEAKTIYLVGKGLSVPIIELFISRLDFLSKNVRYVSMDNPHLLPSRIATATPEDIFVVFSFPSYGEDIIRVAKCAKNLIGSQIIVITDKATAPVATYGDLVLLCHTSALVYYNSITAPMSLVAVLTTLMAIKRNNENLDRITALKKILNPPV